jgi:hypothetical protein
VRDQEVDVIDVCPLHFAFCSFAACSYCFFSFIYSVMTSCLGLFTVSSLMVFTDKHHNTHKLCIKLDHC